MVILKRHSLKRLVDILRYSVLSAMLSAMLSTVHLGSDASSEANPE